MPRRCCRLRWGIVIGVVAIGSGLGGSPSKAAAADGVHPARWIRDDALTYLEVAQPNRWLDRVLSDDVRKTAAALPGVNDYFQSERYRKVVAALHAVATRLGTTPEQGLRDLAGGGVVLAVEQEPGRQGLAPQTLLIVTPSDPKFLPRLSQAIRDELAARGHGDALKVSDHRGVAVYQLGGGRAGAAYAVVADKLVVASRVPFLNDVIDRSLDGLGAGKALADDAAWSTKRAGLNDETQAWGRVRLDRLREAAPKPFAFKGFPPPPATFLFGAWLETFLKADWASAVLTWNQSGLGVELTMPVPAGGRRDALKGFVPPPGRHSAPPLHPPGVVASVSLWRNLSSVWDARAELFPPEVVQGAAKLDGVAGQFFGGRDFGTGVLGALGNNWRLVVARQDHSKLSPVPDLKLPAFALVVELNPDDDDFAQRLKVAFQSFVGLANLGGVQSKSPPLELGSEVFEEVTISTARYMRSKSQDKDDEPVHPRHNFSPSVARVGDQFVLSSTVGLAQDLIHGFKTPAPPESATLAAEADGSELAGLVELNQSRLVMQNMLKKGHDKTQAEREVAFLAEFLRRLGHGKLTVQDQADAVQLNLTFDLAAPQ